MSSLRRTSRWTKASLLLALGILFALPVLWHGRVRGSDHADTVENVQRKGADISDVYMFPSPGKPANVVMAMNVNPLIGSGQGANTFFDKDVLYQFKIDNTGDNVEDLVIQAMFDAPTGSPPVQTVRIAGPVRPSRIGTSNVFEAPSTVTGTTNNTAGFAPVNGMKVFAGARSDPFFLDLQQFVNILPDRGVPAGLTTPPANPNQPMQTSFRNPGVDFLAGLNVLSIVVEVPRASLGGGKIGLWTTTSIRR